MRQVARPILNTIHTVTYAVCATCEGRIIEHLTTPGISRNYGKWEHCTGGAIPNYDCSPATGPTFVRETLDKP